jgi:anti-sigma factor (TIGR02949 family)
LSETDHTHRDDPCAWALQRIEELLARGQDPLDDAHIATHLRDCPPCDKWELTRRVRVVVATKCGQEAIPASLTTRIRLSLQIEETTES